jgi:1-acyl-sn-glycerol-3-phosphate acyltransferase
MGWKQPSSKQFQHLNKYSRSMIVFSHTSYADFFILILYMLAFPEQLKYIRPLVTPGPFRYIGFLLRRMGCIPATKLSQKNGGGINKIVAELEHEQRFISPKGTIIKSEWRSGYFYLSQQLKIPLMVAGLDYEKKCTVIKDGINYDEDQEKIERVLKERLGTIVPLFPEEEIVTIRPYDPSKVSFMRYDRLMLVIMSIMLYYVF